MDVAFVEQMDALRYLYNAYPENLNIHWTSEFNKVCSNLNLNAVSADIEFVMVYIAVLHSSDSTR